ncbi:hypothetical protein DSL72_005442 [Monilinia vaccinii-corymbosi]|uniref:Uncharacterized protein n=1 Tax=Monilinia vaccinii-corymbosi TaxID=61207 RepID=A0A8A3PFN0_9HELO|nr:hypothetical protein DSL72_005442 [Monilinia vaccinii-corymbosi]
MTTPITSDRVSQHSCPAPREVQAGMVLEIKAQEPRQTAMARNRKTFIRGCVSQSTAMREAEDEAYAVARPTITLRKPRENRTDGMISLPSRFLSVPGTVAISTWPPASAENAMQSMIGTMLGREGSSRHEEDDSTRKERYEPASTRAIPKAWLALKESGRKAGYLNLKPDEKEPPSQMNMNTKVGYEDEATGDDRYEWGMRLQWTVRVDMRPETPMSAWTYLEGV